jgi:hypothetical protein
MWFAGRGLEVLLQRHVNLNNSRDRMIDNWLELILQTANALAFSESERVNSLGLPGGD